MKWLLLAGILFTGCGNPVPDPPEWKVSAELRKARQEASAKLCIKKGGVPLWDYWGNVVLRCDR